MFVLFLNFFYMVSYFGTSRCFSNRGPSYPILSHGPINNLSSSIIVFNDEGLHTFSGGQYAHNKSKNAPIFHTSNLSKFQWTNFLPSWTQFLVAPIIQLTLIHINDFIFPIFASSHLTKFLRNLPMLFVLSISILFGG